MKGMSEGGSALKIPLGENQFIWIEHHTDVGFDRHLPGHGILVTQQDRSIGDEERNELNRDVEQPWLRVIEADEGDQMLLGINDGEASDLFTNGTKFGAEGVLIRDHDGILVPWTANVAGEENLSIQFTAPHCTSKFQVNAPDFGAVILPSEPFLLEVDSTIECDLTHNLTMTDGRDVALVPNSVNVGITFVALTFSYNGTANSESLINGVIECDESRVDLSTKILTLARIPIEAEIVGTLDAVNPSTVLIALPSTGDGSQSFSTDLDGPMSRVATIENRAVLNGNDLFEIQIEPNGLLLDGMTVRGELVLIDNNGHRWTYELDYTAEVDDASVLDEWRTPGRILGIICLVGAVWIGMGIIDSNRTKSAPQTQSETQSDSQPIPFQVHPTEELDPWGRPVDGNE
jgi:hypothetical protein